MGRLLLFRLSSALLSSPKSIIETGGAAAGSDGCSGGGDCSLGSSQTGCLQSPLPFYPDPFSFLPSFFLSPSNFSLLLFSSHRSPTECPPDCGTCTHSLSHLLARSPSDRQTDGGGPLDLTPDSYSSTRSVCWFSLSLCGLWCCSSVVSQSVGLLRKERGSERGSRHAAILTLSSVPVLRLLFLNWG